MIFAFAVFVFILAGCKKDNNGSDGGNDNGDGNPFVINISDVIKVYEYSPDITRVLAKMNDKLFIEPTQYENNSCKLTLPSIVSPEFLRDDGYISFGRWLPDEINAKIGELTIYAATDESNGWSGLSYHDERLADENDDNYYYCEAVYLYSSMNFTVRKEYYGDHWDCNFRKGWNVLYYYQGIGYAGWERITTQKPSGVNLKWYLY